jgi:DNA-binding MarR family transcriptional regulator
MKKYDQGLKGMNQQIPPLGPVLEFLRLLWAVVHALHQKSKGMHTSLGITGPQRLVIRIVGRFPGITAGQLAEILQLHPGTLSGILNRLENRRLISRRSDPRDGRRALIGLTPQGRLFDVHAKQTIELAVQESLAELPREQVTATRQVLERVVAKIMAGDSP